MSSKEGGFFDRGSFLFSVCFMMTLAPMYPVHCQPDSSGKNEILTEDSFLPIVPSWYRSVAIMRERIRNSDHSPIVNRVISLTKLDEYFDEAVELCHGNIQQSLFTCAMAMLDHRKIYLKVPLIGGTIPTPLTAESEEEFIKRYRNLPAGFFDDSPRGRNSDKDKLQHFFGSAFLSYSSNSKYYTILFGNFIEWLEPQLVIGGTDDPRDKRANGLGALFGKFLAQGRKVIPSDLLLYSPEKVEIILEEREREE